MEKTLGELALLVGGECHGPPHLIIRGIAAIDKAGPEEITFIAHPKYARLLEQSQAGAIVVSPELAHHPRPLLISANPYLAYAKIAACLAPSRQRWPGVSQMAFVDRDVILGEGVSIAPLAFVGPGAELGDRVTLEPGVVVARGVKIGADSHLYAHATVLEGCILGARVIIHSGTVIGSDGYGYAFDGQRHLKIPQLGTVVIEDDVEVGANCTIDRAALGETRIGAGTKIDNLVQIAHNVTIGEHSLLVAQVGISGSTRLGKYVTLAGQVGVAGHVEIGDGVRVGAQSGVPNSLVAGQTYSGYPVQPHKDWLRTMAALPRVPELLKRIKRLEKDLQDLKTALSKEGGV